MCRESATSSGPIPFNRFSRMNTLALLICSVALLSNSQNYEFDNKATEQISKAKVFIRENLLKGIGPEEVADSLHMSYSWFRKLFKEYTGLSPAHYIQELKIQQAKDLLATTQRSTKEIAYYLTFDDIPYFTKVFKKYTGYTPQSYRKKFGRE